MAGMTAGGEEDEEEADAEVAVDATADPPEEFDAKDDGVA